MRGDGPTGTVSYKRAKYDSNGNFTGEYENVNKSWYDARQDLLKFENRGERSRLSNLMETPLWELYQLMVKEMLIYLMIGH